MFFNRFHIKSRSDSYSNSFKKDGKTNQAARCITSRITTKAIDSIILIDKFEQQCVVLKGILKSLRLKYHVQTIGIDQPLSNNDLYGHKCIENIKKVYKQSGKCNVQKQLKDIIKAADRIKDSLWNKSYV